MSDVRIAPMLAAKRIVRSPIYTDGVPRDAIVARVSDEEKVIGNAAAAEYVGVSVNSWRPYVARGQAPPPVSRQLDKGHALPVWTKAQLDEWMRNRRRRRIG